MVFANATIGPRPIVAYANATIGLAHTKKKKKWSYFENAWVIKISLTLSSLSCHTLHTDLVAVDLLQSPLRLSSLSLHANPAANPKCHRTTPLCPYCCRPSPPYPCLSLHFCVLLVSRSNFVFISFFLGSKKMEEMMSISNEVDILAMFVSMFWFWIFWIYAHVFDLVLMLKSVFVFLDLCYCVFYIVLMFKFGFVFLSLCIYVPWMDLALDLGWFRWRRWDLWVCVLIFWSMLCLYCEHVVFDFEFSRFVFDFEFARLVFVFCFIFVFVFCFEFLNLIKIENLIFKIWKH